MWQAPAECPDRARVQAEIGRLITRAPRAADASSPKVVITRVSDNALQARVSVHAPGGAREHVLHDASCEALTRAAALVVALAIEEGTPANKPARPVAERRTDERARESAPDVNGSAAARSSTERVSERPSRAAASSAARSSQQENSVAGASPGQRDLGAASIDARASGAAAAESSRGIPVEQRGAAADSPVARASAGDAAAALRGVRTEQREAGADASGERAQQARAGRAADADGDADAAAAQRDVVRFEVSLTPRAPERPVLFTRETRVQSSELEAADSQLGAAGNRDRTEPDSRGRAAAGAERLGVFVGAAAGLSSGIIPRLAPTFGLHAGLTRDVWCAALRLGFAPAQAAQLPAAAGAGGSVALMSAALEAGLRLRALGFEFPALAGLESGVFLARGLGVAEHSLDVSDWLAGYLSPGISRTWAERLRLFLRLDGLLALRRPRFALEAPAEGERVFHRPDRFGARIYLGLDVILR